MPLILRRKSHAHIAKISDHDVSTLKISVQALRRQLNILEENLEKKELESVIDGVSWIAQGLDNLKNTVHLIWR